MSPTHQDLSNDTTFSQIKSRVPVPLRLGWFSADILTHLQHFLIKNRVSIFQLYLLATISSMALFWNYLTAHTAARQLCTRIHQLKGQ